MFSHSKQGTLLYMQQEITCVSIKFASIDPKIHIYMTCSPYRILVYDKLLLFKEDDNCTSYSIM